MPTAARLAFLLPHLRGGGAETVIVRIAGALARRGHDVHLLALTGAGDLAAVVSGDVTVHDLGCARTRYALPAVVRCLRRLRPRAAVATLGRLNVLLTLARPLLGGIRVVVREANTPSVDLARGGHGWLLRLLYPRVYPHMHTVVCQSDAMQADIAASFSIDPARLVRIYNPAPHAEIDLALAGARNPFEADEQAVVACGRLAAQKQFDVLLDAFAALRAGHPRARLHMLGDGADRARLQARSQALGLGDRVVWHGYRGDRFRFFHFARVVVSTSGYEGLPNVLIEALSCGTPVVATDCPGGTGEIVRDGVNGWLVPVGHVDAIAARLGDVLDGCRPTATDLRATLGAFDPERTLDRWEALLCDGRTPRADS